ncbi:putative Protein downstream neighbor of son-like protein [Hypsibius exemplaris]|uniref:Uncharacterized protein n=1 Tax=Hypsibius exemplaris TaxID=2072580 RepID=A0A1W0WNB4_HYPEX|nr:putative Protein downstream neighbor of son-like protein [Hypsibius exemplaris]
MMPCSPRKVSTRHHGKSPKKSSPLRNVNPNIVQSAPSKASSSRNLGWTKPNAVLSKYKNRKSLNKNASSSSVASSGKRSRTEVENDSGFSGERSSDGGGSLVKRTLSNPFMRQDSTEDAWDIYSSSLPLALSFEMEASPLVEHLRLKEKRTSLGMALPDYAEVETVGLVVSEKADVKKVYIPYKDFFDWSLKTNLRITVRKDLRFIKDLTTQDRVQASCGTKTVSQAAQFLRQMKYWTFPNLNGIKTFPRLSNSSTSTEDFTDWKKLMPALQQNWDVALKELKDSVQLDMCPYFYIVTHQWTALILSKRVSHTKTLRAFVGPTNMGFRQLVKQLKIEFDMPLRNSTNASVDGKDQEELNSSGGSDSLAANNGTRWILETIKTSNGLKLHNENAVDVVEHAVDNKPESLITMEATEVLAFLDALVNFRSLIPGGGPLLNVPPTLISPVTFACATAERLKYVYCEEKGNTYVGVTGGPILPHVIPSLVHLLRGKDHNSDVLDTVAYTTYDGTLAFTRLCVPEEKPNHQINPETSSVAFADIQLPQVDAHYASATDEHNSHVVPTEVLNLMSSFVLLG